MSTHVEPGVDPASPGTRGWVRFPGARPSTLALIAVTGTSGLATDTYIAALPAM